MFNDAWQRTSSEQWKQSSNVSTIRNSIDTCTKNEVNFMRFLTLPRKLVLVLNKLLINLISNHNTDFIFDRGIYRISDWRHIRWLLSFFFTYCLPWVIKHLVLRRKEWPSKHRLNIYDCIVQLKRWIHQSGQFSRIFSSSNKNWTRNDVEWKNKIEFF